MKTFFLTCFALLSLTQATTPGRPAFATEEEEDEWEINRLTADPVLHAQGLQMRARKLLLDGDIPAARKKIDESLAHEKPTAERLRLRGEIALRQKDSSLALVSFQQAWQMAKEETDFTSLLALRRGLVDIDFLKENAGRYAGHAGAAEAIYDACVAPGRAQADLRFCAELAHEAQEWWWPRSVDWKVRYARALILSGRGREAKPVLLNAMAMLDERADSLAAAGPTPALRREVFKLMEQADRS